MTHPVFTPLADDEACMRLALQQAVAAGAAGGHDWIWLGTNQGNERALRFYRKHGFGIIGRRTFEVGPVVEVDFVLARPVHTVEA